MNSSPQTSHTECLVPKRLLIFVFALLLLPELLQAGPIAVTLDSRASPRIQFGVARLAQALTKAGFEVGTTAPSSGEEVNQVIVGTVNQACIKDLLSSGALRLNVAEFRREGFVLECCSNRLIAVVGADDSGVLYGCLELAKRISETKKIPNSLHFSDAPAFTLRGTCIGMQKTYILPGRRVYEYPYTPELFPFFYDKAFWQEYLDFLVDNRMNTLYLWNGHPFASLVRLQDYPYAVEVSDQVFARNQEMFRYITHECDKRGIWLVQMFYNILLSKPFAERNGLPTQLAAPTPVAADYTRKSIAGFVHEYPNVGLMVCLGEALQGTESQLNWCTNVILPGILDGMKLAGLGQQPPLVIRTHAMDANVIVPAAARIYTNLFTESKYNGESLTTWEPRGKQQQIHLAMARLSPHLVNVHILSNLEPFRYGDQQFIRHCVQAARERLGASGLHLYPLAYWSWPDSPDLAYPPLEQWRRDWIWFEAWARYVWAPDIPELEDHAFWISRLTEQYGNAPAAKKILEAYNDSGECAPRLIRRFGITEGNRQTLSLGMTLDQLVNAEEYNALSDLWESQAPPGERLPEFVEKEWHKQPHTGETPDSVIREVLQFSQQAVNAVEVAASLVIRDREEFERLRNDVHCIRAMSEFYAAKVTAAMHVLRYNFSHELADMEQAEKELATSLEHYRELAALTAKTYRFANSMQTSQRKIPFPGGTHGVGTNYHWVQLLPLYEKELASFQARMEELRKAGDSTAGARANVQPWAGAAFHLLSTNAETYKVQIGARVFTDRRFPILGVAPELDGLTGIRFSHQSAKKGRYQPIEFEVSEPVLVLVGYFRSKDPTWLQVPQLETAAQADERGGIDTVLRNAAIVESCPPIDVHAFRYAAGRQRLELMGKGSFVILGVVPEKTKLTLHGAEAGLKGGQ